LEVSRDSYVVANRVVRLISRANLLLERAKEDVRKAPRPALRLGRANPSASVHRKRFAARLSVQASGSEPPRQQDHFSAWWQLGKLGCARANRDSVLIATVHDNRFGSHFLAQRSPRLAGAMPEWACGQFRLAFPSIRLAQQIKTEGTAPH
jgi:hypothetical protein